VPGLKVGRIVEFFYPETPVGRESALLLLKECLVFLKNNHCDFVDFYSMSDDQLELFKQAGFVMESEAALPNRLDPLDTSRRFKNLEVFVADALKTQYPDCEKYFYSAGADGDQDRPNQLVVK
jgi:hypothetical protein